MSQLCGCSDTKVARTVNYQLVQLFIGGFVFVVALVFTFPPLVELLLYIVSYLIVGSGVVIDAIKSMLKGRLFSEHFLMAVATIGAFLIGEYPEAVGVMLFYLIGEIFQNRALAHSRKSIGALMDIRPDFARIRVGEQIASIPPEKAKIGDTVLIYPGEKIPLDGRVIEGSSLADTSALTGESLPRELTLGDEAMGGFVNLSGLLVIEVTKLYGDSTVAKILELVEHASSNKAQTEKFITKFARYYTPVVVYAALALAIVPPLLLEGATFSEWLYRALVFLVISCPCALVISIPLGFFGGIGGASKRGILIKGSNYLEALNNAEIVIFDKTGTLTKGTFEVTNITPAEPFTAQELLEYAAFAEHFSNHPIGTSITKAYAHTVNSSRITGFTERAGFGTETIYDNRKIIAGNAALMALEQIDITTLDAKLSEQDLTEKVGTIIHVAVDNAYAGFISISDEIKENSAQAIRDLALGGIKKTVMLSGDRASVAHSIGQQLGIDEIYAELLPADKVKLLESFEQHTTKKGAILFVGDGINDAPSLARADIGIAMGGLGSDAAIEAADIVIMNDDPYKIVEALRIAHRTRRIVFQNVVLALGIKSVFLTLGAFGYTTMWEAVFADVGVALLAIFNATRVLNTKSR